MKSKKIDEIILKECKRRCYVPEDNKESFFIGGEWIHADDIMDLIEWLHKVKSEIYAQRYTNYYNKD